MRARRTLLRTHALPFTAARRRATFALSRLTAHAQARIELRLNDALFILARAGSRATRLTSWRALPLALRAGIIAAIARDALRS